MSNIISSGQGKETKIDNIMTRLKKAISSDEGGKDLKKNAGADLQVPGQAVQTDGDPLKIGPMKDKLAGAEIMPLPDGRGGVVV